MNHIYWTFDCFKTLDNPSYNISCIEHIYFSVLYGCPVVSAGFPHKINSNNEVSNGFHRVHGIIDGGGHL